MRHHQGAGGDLEPGGGEEPHDQGEGRGLIVESAKQCPAGEGTADHDGQDRGNLCDLLLAPSLGRGGHRADSKAPRPGRKRGDRRIVWAPLEINEGGLTHL